MKIIAKKSNELSSGEIRGLYKLYERVFHEKRNEKFFYDQYCNTSKGYSYHALAIDDGKVVGHNVYVPFEYIKANKENFTLVLSIDAMVDPDYQGKGIYRKLLTACEKIALSEDVKIRIGFPNENSYPIQKKVFKYHDFGTLGVYMLPLKPSKISKWLKFLNPISSLITYLKIRRCDDKEANRVIFKRNIENFNSFRYNWFDGEYNIVSLPDGTRIVYKDYSFKSIPATFLIDINPLTDKSLQAACKYIYKNNINSAFVIFVGILPFRTKCMLKIPKFAEPKNFHFVGKIYDVEFFGEDGLKKENWDINLSSFDLL